MPARAWLCGSIDSFGAPAARNGVTLVARLAGHAEAAVNRPNILGVIAKDMCSDLGCYGTPPAKTPHIDRAILRWHPVHPGFHDVAGLFRKLAAFMTGM